MLSIVVLAAACTSGATRFSEPTPSGAVAAATATPVPTRGDDRRASTSPLPTPSATTAPSGTRRIVLRAAGDSDHRTKPVKLDASWSISWRHDGGHLFSVQVIPAGSDVFGELVVATTTRTTGTQPMYRAGTFVVRVFACDRWALTITDEPVRAATPIPTQLTGVGSTNTARLSVAGRWVVDWTLAAAGPFGLELYPLPSGEPWLLAAADGPRVGCAPVTKEGTVYLHVVTDLRWTLRISGASGEIVCPAA